MNDFDSILNNISRFIQLGQSETDEFISHLKIVRIKRKQQIVQPDFVCKYRTYVVSGALKAYIIDPEDGQEHVIGLAIDDWWISDFSSYINQKPATFFVEAVEDSIIIQLSFENEQKLYDQIPKFERFFRLHAQRTAAGMQKRMLSSISKTAEERFEELSGRYPKFLLKFPQYVIASYLGITTQFLSRIRNNRSKS
ncbi:Crp/Fnr family transcriptional regulator [Mucilaginibacter pedocola]|uniref:Crp/Fnr family transcriptional regulator n=1 Tax=Mucilaginibacter pedocola TaxID=1792845 RepID=A0A1S9PL26_9SPHI|nr:Crp/Fnr family transcriptional regulator [Mucilaginibacter pedocola]OOQ61629.1 Crp/Fnr family transcriptional regulator [Mucilaginibacter pedocola]